MKTTNNVSVDVLNGTPGLRTGICVVCRGTLDAHFKDQEWAGCPKAPAARQGAPLFVPFIVMTPEMLRALPATSDQRPVKDRRAPNKTRVTRKTSSVQRDPVAEGSRGRKPGRYVAGPEPKKVATDSILAVWKLLKSRKTGLKAKDVSAKLEMPMGTVGWALRHLKRQGAATYTAAA
jgi:hypothetical protein